MKVIERIERAFAVSGDPYVVAASRQPRAQHPSDLRFVIDDENTLFLRHWLLNRFLFYRFRVRLNSVVLVADRKREDDFGSRSSLTAFNPDATIMNFDNPT